MNEWLGTVWQDAAVALRSLGRQRGFAMAALATLALGIGATVTIVSLVDGVLLRPLPYADPSQLFAVVDRIVSTGDESMASPLELAELQRRVSAFEGLARPGARYPRCGRSESNRPRRSGKAFSGRGERSAPTLVLQIGRAHV